MDHSLLQKFLKGGCNEAEAAAVRQWLEQHPEEAGRYMAEAWEEDIVHPMPADMEQRLRASLRVQRNSRRIRPVAWWAAAAAMVLAVAGLWFVLNNGRTAVQPASDMLAIATAGKHVLPDGSEVWLKTGTHIRIDTTAYGKTSRNILLDRGEAFFDVRKNENAPFAVVCGNTLTKVLGTSFSIAAGKSVQVAVATGRVSVQAGRKAAVALDPGSSISVNEKGDTAMSALPAWLPGLWKENTLQLTDAGFDELRMALHAFYGVHVQTGSAHVKAQRYNIRLQRATPVADVIEVLGSLNGIHHQQRNDSTYLIN